MSEDPFILGGVAVAATARGGKSSDPKEDRKFTVLLVGVIALVVAIVVGAYFYSQHRETVRFDYWSHNQQVQIVEVNKTTITFKGVTSGETRTVNTKEEFIAFDRHAAAPAVGQTWKVELIASKMRTQPSPGNFFVELDPVDSSPSK